MLLGYLFLGLAPVLVRSARDVGWNAPFTVVARFGLASVFIVFIAAARRRWLTTNNRWLLIWRGIFGGLAVLLYFTSVQLTGAGVGTLLNYTYPIWANVFGAVFLGQRGFRGFWALLAVAVAGVYLVIDPVWTQLPSFGELAGIVSAMLAGAAVLCIKKLRETDESLSIIWSFSVFGLLFSVPVAVLDTLASTKPLPWSDLHGWWLLVLTGVFSFLGHVYFTRGYKHTSLQLGSVLALTVPVVAVLCGWWFLDEPLSPTFVAGGLLILAASAWIGIRDGQELRAAASAESITGTARSAP
ncbi:MAG TPA: DMT family transporter [Polyangiaceae bacterium]